MLDGTKPWCSLAAELSHAIITAHTGPLSRRAFAISLGDGVSPLPGTWVSRGLIDVPSGGLQLDGVAAVSVGEDEWYLTRPGFAWGGIAVAAVWFGAAQALRTPRRARPRRPRLAGPCQEDLRLVTRAIEAGTCVTATDAIRVRTSSRLVARAPDGFASYLRELASPA